MVTTIPVFIGTIMLLNCNNKCAIIVVMLFNVTMIILMLSSTLPKISVFKTVSKKKKSLRITELQYLKHHTK